MSDPGNEVADVVDHLFRREYGRIVAVLTSRLGLDNLDAAEDLVQETLAAAVHHWAVNGVPDAPAAWLMQVAKNKAVNLLKSGARRKALHRRFPELVDSMPPAEVFLRTDIEDSVLRLIFTCCHPELSQESQLALTLTTLLGFGPEEVARALLVSEDAVKKRIYRAKRDMRERRIPFEVPGGRALDERLEMVLTTLYVTYTEGYSTTVDESWIRKDLCLEAMRLARLLADRFRDRPAISALLALMCFHTARFDSRLDAEGGVVLLADQDRSQWDRELIQLGFEYLTDSARGEHLTHYHLEASIAAQHCSAASFAETDWRAIQRFYEKLDEIAPNPLVRLNLAIVVSEVSGAEAGLAELENLKNDKRLARYPLMHATLGELCRRTGRRREAREHIQEALKWAQSARERALLETKLRELSGG